LKKHRGSCSFLKSRQRVWYSAGFYMNSTLCIQPLAESKASDIGQAVGFASQAKFGAAFKGYFGITPLEYRRRCRLGEIGY